MVAVPGVAVAASEVGVSAAAEVAAVEQEEGFNQEEK